MNDNHYKLDSMNVCRICGSMLGHPMYSSSGPSITSVRTVLDVPLALYLCPQCHHAQKAALLDTSDYYDSEYRISLQSDDFDQLYDLINGKSIYRTDYQAELVLKSTNIPAGSSILDYGAGKASTLNKIATARPDLVPYAFDVSEDYRDSWCTFLLQERQATYRIPESWDRLFSLVMAHFVLEHAEDPCGFFSNISKLLAPDGMLFFSVPNLISNPGDLLAIDHINHFSISSIHAALKKTGMSLVSVDKDVFRGAIVCVAKRNNAAPEISFNEQPGYENEIKGIANFWTEYDNRLELAVAQYPDLPAAIFGAGVYGSFIASKIGNRAVLKCFLDNSLHLANSTHMELPVIPPSNISGDIQIIYSGLNPAIARAVLEPLRTDKIKEIVYFDEGVL